MKQSLSIIIFWWGLISINPIHAHNKYVIGNWHAGFFSCFLSVLNNLAWCDQNNKTPVVYWDHTSNFYSDFGFNGTTNVWEYYFEPVSSLNYTPGDQIHRDYWIRFHKHFHCYKTNQQTRDYANSMIKKYIKIKPCIQEKVDHFYNNHMHEKQLIGVHLRGTDKRFEQKPIPVQHILHQARKYANEHTYFYIASEDAGLLDQAKDILGEKIIFYDCIRTCTTDLEWFAKHPHRAQLGEEVLIESQLLSRCQMFIHTNSNVSTAVLYFNPELKHEVVT